MKEKRTANEASMEDSKFHQFFMDCIKDIYWAEKALVKELPELANAAHSSKLSKAISSHLEETKEHVNRLEQVFENLNEKPEAVKCEAMNGLLKEAKEIKAETEDDHRVEDAALIVACQKVEHYEIATYGTLVAFAQIMGHEEVKQLLEETLGEEKNADKLLNELALSEINEKAATE